MQFCIISIFPFDKMITVKNLKIFSKSFIERICLIAEMLFDVFAKFSDIFFAINKRPYKASCFIEMNITDLWLFQKLLCQSVKNTFILNVKSHHFIIIH